jgi:DNA-binding beta-propeller fold protein YncE
VILAALLLCCGQDLQAWDLASPERVAPGGDGWSDVVAVEDGLVIALDSGALLRLDPAGRELARFELPGRPDLEGLTLGPPGQLLAIVENTCEVLVLSAADLSLIARHPVDRRIPRGKKGAESLLLVGGPRGELWIGHQGSESVYVTDPPRGDGALLRLRSTRPVDDEVRGMTAVGEHVLQVVDDRRQLWWVDRSGRRLDVAFWPLGSQSIEGVTVDAAGRLILCMDGGPLLAYPPRVRPSPGPKLEPVGSWGDLSGVPEIVTARGSLVVATHPLLATVQALRVDWSGTAPGPVELKFDAGPPGVGRGGPTSVALHPDLPRAYMTELSAPRKPGRLTAVDLSTEAPGSRLWSVEVGHHPDSVAVSKDGRYGVVADEGEARGESGSVHVVDLATRKASRIEVWENVAASSDRVQPEYVAISANSALAAVSCQENDAVVFIDLRDTPRRAPATWHLTRGAQPDGVAVLELSADGGGYLVAAAEEGGNALGLAWLSADLTEVRPLARFDFGPTGVKVNPEAVLLRSWGERRLALVGLERADAIALLDVTQPHRPVLLDLAPSGPRPEGLAWLEGPGGPWLLSADEGKGGGLSLLRLDLKE